MGAKDIFFKLKQRAFNQCFLPDDGISLSDFVIFCKMHLCNTYKIPTKSTVWDEYTDEDIIIEYFSIKFLKDTSFKDEFISQKNGTSLMDHTMDEDEFFKWAEKQEMDQKKELEKLKAEGDTIHFSPSGE